MTQAFDCCRYYDMKNLMKDARQLVTGAKHSIFHVNSIY